MPQLPPQVIFSLVVETGLVLLTCFLVVQPESVFRGVSGEIRRSVGFAGMVSLCLTFCWSVIFGCVLALNDVSQRI
jgi:hypothetical protein